MATDGKRKTDITSHYIYTSQNHKDKHLDGKKMENDKVSISTEWFDLVVRGVLVPSLGCLGILFNFMIIIVLRRPEFTKVSINLIMLCKFTHTMFFKLPKRKCFWKMRYTPNLRLFFSIFRPF